MRTQGRSRGVGARALLHGRRLGTLALVALSLSLASCDPNLTPRSTVPDDARLSCLPVLDGHIRSWELPGVPGASGRYAVGSGPVDYAGTIDAAGRRSWDWQALPKGATTETLTVLNPSDQWFGAHFPGAHVAVPLDDATVAVYRQDDDALWLLGVASTVAQPPGGQTLLVYDAPAALLRFPLHVGAAWTSTGVVTGGTLLGLPYHGTDTYDVRVDGSGTLRLSWLDAGPTLRVTTRVTVALKGVAPIVRHQVSFFFPCLGELARATSDHDDWSQVVTARQLVP